MKQFHMQISSLFIKINALQNSKRWKSTTISQLSQRKEWKGRWSLSLWKPRMIPTRKSKLLQELNHPLTYLSRSCSQKNQLLQPLVLTQLLEFLPRGRNRVINQEKRPTLNSAGTTWSSLIEGWATSLRDFPLNSQRGNAGSQLETI